MYIFPPVTFTRVVIIKLLSIVITIDIYGDDIYIYRPYLILSNTAPKIVFRFTPQNAN